MVTEPDSTTGRARRNLWRLLRIALTVALLYWVLSRVSLEQVLDTLRAADARLLVAAFLLYQVGTLVRATRWWVLLRGSEVAASFLPVLGLTYIGQFFNLSLPTGVAGDAVRAIEFDDGRSRATSAGIVILDRMLGLLTLFAVALVALGLGYRILGRTTALILAAIALGGLVLLVLALQRNVVLRLTAFLPQSISLAGESWLGRLYGALTGCAASSVWAALALSLLNTALTIGLHFTAAQGVGVPLGIGVFAMLTPIVNLGVLLPSVGGLGLNEVGYQLLLTPLGVEAPLAVALGFSVYLARLSAALLGGAYYLLWVSRR
jgi:uncharacterized membrane protein YbhN (UPF0104 family)